MELRKFAGFVYTDMPLLWELRQFAGFVYTDMSLLWSSGSLQVLFIQICRSYGALCRNLFVKTINLSSTGAIYHNKLAESDV